MNYKLVHSIITTMSIALVMIIMIISNGATQCNAAKLNSLNDWCYSVGISRTSLGLLPR